MDLKQQYNENYRLANKAYKRLYKAKDKVEEIKKEIEYHEDQLGALQERIKK